MTIINNAQAKGFYAILRKILFSLNPETAHNLTFKALKLGRYFALTRLLSSPKKLNSPVKVMGINFPNHLGLAAGLDKDGIAVTALSELGFGSIEVGTVTPLPQPGNPKPRLFRIPERGALINRMGFNNLGIDNLLDNLHKQSCKSVIGINIGKQMTTAVEDALQDYIIGLQKAFPFADYIAVNISSPNTPNLRQLQKLEALESLLKGLKKVHNDLCQKYKIHKPLALKVAPDLNEQEIQNISSLLIKYQIDALIATNTTISREGVDESPIANEKGGLSGAPLTQKSTEIIRLFAKELNGQIPIIAAGGIMSGQDALDKLEAGASLVQIYTGFIYKGPGLIKEILWAIKNK